LAKKIPPKKKLSKVARRTAAKTVSREQILKFVAENPQRNSKRDIAKAFNIKGTDKIHLKAVLRELIDEGKIERRGKRLSQAGQLPPVTVVDVLTRDRNGGLLGKPVDWDEAKNGKAPVIEVSTRASGKEKVAGVGNRVLAKVFRLGDSDRYSAKVIKILPKAETQMLGVVRIGENGIRLESAVRRQGEMDIPADLLGEAQDGDLVTVETIKGPKYGLKRAKVTGVIGSYKTEKAASIIAIFANEIPHVFPESVIHESEAIKPVSQGKREDWRDIPLITIDPADAKDHDDAIQAEPDPDVTGGFIVRVAIADVSAYIKSGSAMDREALLRGNSVYFPDRVVPMLPERISNNLCSLREGEDRPALAVKMYFDAEGRKTKHTFHRVLMRNHANLAYPRYQAAMRGRNHRQPLELDLPERKILLKEDGTVDRVLVPERLDAHKLVEECMIQANVCAAETLERKNQQLIYRVHEPPSLDKMEKLKEFLSSLDMSLAKPGNLRAMHFNQILSEARGTENEELVSQVVLRGLGEGGITPHEEKTLDEIAAGICITERRAMQAERETIDRLIAGFLAEQIGASFHGRINGVTKAGLFVTLDDTGADGFIPISMLGDEYFIFDDTIHAVIGEATGQQFQMGQRVEVKLVEAAPVAGALRFEMISEGVEGRCVAFAAIALLVAKPNSLQAA